MHLERKIWSEKKCGILKSAIFAPCHSEVDVDKYMKRCIFDACACDQGGDCECLCTAIAAYAHVCTTKGVPIKWRTPDLCREYFSRKHRPKKEVKSFLMLYYYSGSFSPFSDAM